MPERQRIPHEQAGEPEGRSPEEAAEALVREAPDADWLQSVVAEVVEQVPTEDLTRFIDAWGLSLAEAASIFGVTRQAVAKWRDEGVPVGRRPAVADLATATEILERRVRRDRIPAVVRREAEMLDGRSLLAMARDGEHAAVREAVRRMFDLRRAQP